MPESKYQAGFGVIISGQNPQTFMIPIYSTTVLYDRLKVNGSVVSSRLLILTWSAYTDLLPVLLLNVCIEDKILFHSINDSLFKAPNLHDLSDN